jgi:hypothetical protein
MLEPSLIYAAVQGETRLEFQRGWLERAAVTASALGFAVVLAGFLCAVPKRRA